MRLILSLALIILLAVTWTAGGAVLGAVMDPVPQPPSPVPSWFCPAGQNQVTVRAGLPECAP